MAFALRAVPFTPVEQLLCGALVPIPWGWFFIRSILLAVGLIWDSPDWANDPIMDHP